MSDSSDGSASTTARPKRNADSEVNANRRLRTELEDEARLGSAPQLDINPNTQSLDADASEGPTSELSKAKHMSVYRRMLRPLTERENELLQEVQMNPVSDQESASISSFSDTESIKNYSDYEDEMEDKDPSILPHVPASSAENKEPNLEEVSRLWSHAMQYRILCKIRCGNSQVLRHHFAEYYEDVPFKSLDSGVTSRHLSGHIPVPSLKRYISTIKTRASFLVFREYNCSNTRRYAPRHRKPVFPRLASLGRGKQSCDESIVVISNSLETAIRRAAICHPPKVFNDIERAFLDVALHPLVLTPPYAFVYHHRSLLVEHAKNCTSSIRNQILALLDYVEGNFGARFKQADELFRRGKTDQRTLEYLFCPGDIVLSYKQVTYAAYNLTSWLNPPDSLECWGWTFDGVQFLRKCITLSIRPDQIRTTVPIQELPVYPIKYAPQDLRNDLKRRGERFWNLRFQHYISYTGWDVFKDENYVATRCMVDYRTYRRFHPGAPVFNLGQAPLDDFSLRDYRLAPMRQQKHIPNEEDLYMMPPHVHAFVIQDKKWVSLRVENVGEVSWNKEAFERLVLPSRTKDLVKALVMVRASKHGKRQDTNLGKRDDIIASKGNGLIILLHGGPGTGKTLTAESVAELAEMPLYRVTCGDIGTNVEAVEKYLQTILYLGNTWNCVLLLDEADVFLEERTLADFERNNFVSVFLRILEYYEGILILTSNRVGTFDEAFRSRMQVALHYPNLNPTSRKKIWQNFFNMLQEDGEDVDVDEIKLHMDELADHDMNGREIRNALGTARQLALYKKERLTWDHLEHTIKTAADFNKYLKNVHGHTDEQYARYEKLR